MNKVIVYKQDNGVVAIVRPCFGDKRQILVSEAVYRTVTVPATDDMPEHDAQELVTPAVYRDETYDEYILAVALKDVPAGKPFKIIDADQVPTDRSQRNAWTVDEVDLTDGTGANYGAGSNVDVVAWDETLQPVLKERIHD
ncbi:hypothetical protein [Rhodoferax sp.]|jgi:hypothetical protein|uniref:hypothetical protein n=1 Tax=Rhodoferax sp. TaxID=50421 RepID=UPI0037837292